jgi:rhodanese-related sulfurtransferase
MFLGLYYLTATSKALPEANDSQTAKGAKTLNWTDLAAVVAMLFAFLTLPFSRTESHATSYAQSESVDRTAVEAAIANHSAIIIDARPDFQYKLSHLLGAINIPYESDNLIELVNMHALKNQALIIYGSSAHCDAAELLAEKLRALGCKKVSIYPGGWEEWERVSGREGDGVK